MKRYLCSRCNRVVRCRRLPDDVTENTNARPAPGCALIGTCRHHESKVSRTVLNNRARVVAGLGSTRRVSASAAKTKSKKS